MTIKKSVAASDLEQIRRGEMEVIKTSAKTGRSVGTIFEALAREIMGGEK